MKCGCAKTDALECAAQMYRDDPGAYLMLWHKYDKADRCDCECHPRRVLSAKRLKLSPEKNPGNTSSGNPS